MKISHWGEARSATALQVGIFLLGCLLEDGSRTWEMNISFSKPEVSLWFAHQHQKKTYRMSPKIMKGIVIPLHVTAYRSMFPNLFLFLFIQKGLQFL